MPSIDHAKRVQRRQADALAKLASGRLSLHDVLDIVPGALKGVPVHYVIGSVNGIGPITVRRVLERANIWPLETLGKLSEYERDAIRNYLPERVS